MFELAVVLSAAAVIAGAVAPSYVKSVYIDAARKSALEISQIQEASRAYFVRKKVWPVDVGNLQSEGYLDISWKAINPFGNEYLLEVQGQTLLVKTAVPKEVSGVMLGVLPVSSFDGAMLVSDVARPGIDAERLPVGAVIPWPSADIPAGWLLCDGSLISRGDHSGLFTLLGVIYGAGDGSTTFNLPDLRGRTVVGMDNMGGSAANVIQGNWARQLGGAYGEEKHALTVSEMPSHRHYGFGENIAGWANGALGPNNNPGPNNGDHDNYLLGTTLSGGDTAHNIIQPSIALNWIIKG